VNDKVSVTVIIPAKNEFRSIGNVVRGIVAVLPEAEIIVINDGSGDGTGQVAEEFGARVISHIYSRGNGAAIKSGARAAKGEVLVMMDADGQHDPEDIPCLLEKMAEGHDMVVGARQGMKSQANLARGGANKLYNKIASWMVGHAIADLTSGFRAVRRKKFLEFISLLPNGFSYPTTTTMAFFRAGYSVAYVPIIAKERLGSSHISLVKDGIRFFIIIFKVGTLYSPLKLFFPISSGFFLMGIIYYLYTYLSDGRFTNMSALLFITSILVFLIGLVSEQITILMYKESNGDSS